MNNEVHQFNVLKKRNSNEALDLLKKIASQVMPIMRKRGWKITHLNEFFPKNPNLLGTNVNRGFKINIRLRPHYDDSVFLEYNDLLGTMLHELVHIVRGPHDATFYELLDELNDELDELLISGQTGYVPLGGQGQRLGGMVATDPKHQALKAAEQRQQIQKIMLPSGGVRLGSTGSGNALEAALGPGFMAVYAAERRLKDQKWCGGLKELADDDNNDHVGSSSSNSTNERALDKAILISSDDDDDGEDHARSTVDRRRRRTSCSDERSEPQKKRVLPTAVPSSLWTCASCTFENDDLVLACTVCLSERPAPKSMPAGNMFSCWSCPQCTLLNKPTFLACDACGQEKELAPL